MMHTDRGKRPAYSLSRDACKSKEEVGYVGYASYVMNQTVFLIAFSQHLHIV